MKWQIRDEESGKRILTDQLEIVIIEIPKAKNKQKEIAQNLLKMKMSIQDIQKATGLTEEEIENIKNEK